MVHNNTVHYILLLFVFMQVSECGWKIDEIKRKVGQVTNTGYYKKPGPILNGCNLCVWEACTPAIKKTSADVFNPQADASELQNALHSWTKGATVISILTSRSESQRQEISNAFKARSPSSLAVEVAEYFRASRSVFLLTALVTPLHEFYAHEFHRVIDLMANKKVEGQIIFVELLTTLPPCLIRKISQSYTEIFDKRELFTDIEAALKSKYSQTDYIDILITMAKGTRDDDFRVSWIKAWRDAGKMKEAIVEDNWDKKKTVFREVFTKRSIPQLAETVRLYEKLRETDIGYDSLVVDINMKMESVKEIYQTMVKIVKDQSLYFADVFSNILDKRKELDNFRFIYLVRGRCDIDLGDITNAYVKKNKQSLINKFIEREKNLGQLYDTIEKII